MPAIVGGMYKLIQQLNEYALDFTTQDIVPGAEYLLDISKQFCPVDTGELRDSGHIEIESDDVTIVYDVPYASYVEFGTYKMEAQPFLRPVLDAWSDEALIIILDAIQSNRRDITKDFS